MVFPNCGPFPQISQTRAITLESFQACCRNLDFTGIRRISPRRRRGRRAYAALPITGCEQWLQRRASIGISLRHSGHFLVVGSAGTGSLRVRATRALIGVTTKKKTTPATSRKLTTAVMKSPIGNTVPLIAKEIPVKSGLPTRSAMMGLIMSLTRAVMIVPNAAPMSTPTARSTTLPRKINCLKPDNIWASLHPGMGDTVNAQWPWVKMQSHSAPLGKGLKSAEARTAAAPRNLRRYVEDIFDHEVVGNA